MADPVADLLNQRDQDYPTNPPAATPAPGTTPVVPPPAPNDAAAELLAQRAQDYPQEARPTIQPPAPLTWLGKAEDFGSGVVHGLLTLPRMAAQGMADVAGPGGWLERTTGIQGGHGASPEVMRVLNAQAEAQFNHDHNSGYATAGNIVGQTLPTLPLIGAGGAVVGAIGDAAGAAAPALAPTIDFLTGAYNGTGVVGRTAQAASRALPAATSGAVSTALTGQTDPTNLLVGAGTGGAVGAVAPWVAEGLSRIGGYTSSLTPTLADFIDNAKNKFGINLRATQVPGALPTSAKVAQKLASSVSLGGAGSETAPVLAQFRDAVAKSAGILPHAGEDVPAVTPSAIADAQTQNIASRLPFESRPASLGDLTPRLAPAVSAAQTVGGADAPVLGKMFNGVMDAAQNGKSYGDILADLEQQAKLSGSPTVQRTIAQTKNAVQDAIQDDLDKNPHISFGDPVHGDFYSRLRTEQHNLDILKTANVGSDGQITPDALRDATRQAAPFQGDTSQYAGNPNYKLPTPPPGEDGYKYAPNGKELDELSSIGSGIGKPPDTLTKLLGWGKKLEWPTAIAAHALSGFAGGIPTAGAGGVGLIGIANAINRGLASKGLINRLAANAGQPVKNFSMPYAAPAAAALDANDYMNQNKLQQQPLASLVGQ